jgi:hypothetical protein
MGVPVVAFPIGGQAELISQTPSAQFIAREVSAKAFIIVTKRISIIALTEIIKLRKDIAETTSSISSQEPTLYTLLRRIP